MVSMFIRITYSVIGNMMLSAGTVATIENSAVRLPLTWRCPQFPDTEITSTFMKVLLSLVGDHLQIDV